MAKWHLQTSIEGLMRLKDKKLGKIFDMNGQEVRKELQSLLDKGHKLLKSEGCEHFDPYEKGCQCGYYENEER